MQHDEADQRLFGINSAEQAFSEKCASAIEVPLSATMLRCSSLSVSLSSQTSQTVRAEMRRRVISASDGNTVSPIGNS